MYDHDTTQELTMWADENPTPVFNFPEWRDPSWMDKAACKLPEGASRAQEAARVKMFHPNSNAGINRAKMFCAGCPVRRECLDYGIAMDPSSDHGEGIWGGATPAERKLIANGEKVTLFAECKRPDCNGVVPQTFNKTYCNRVCADRHARDRRDAA